MGFISNMLAQAIFDQARLIAGLYSKDRQSLSSALINPAGWQLIAASDAHFDPGAIGQIDKVIGKTVFLAPLRVATGAVMKVTFFRAHNTAVALRQLGKTGVTIALTKALFRAPATVNAMNITEVLKADTAANKFIQGNSLFIQGQLILNRAILVETGVHLFQMAGGLE